MNERRLLLNKTDSWILHDAASGVVLEEGSACLYIVPWDEMSQLPGRRVKLCDLQPGRPVPAFCWTHPQDGTQWRFEILPMQDGVVFTELPGMATLPLKRRFLESLQLPFPEEETFEGCMLDFYTREILKEEVDIHQSGSRARKAEGEAGQMIKNAVVDKQPVVSLTGEPLYDLLARIAPRCKFSLAPIDKLKGLHCDMSLESIAAISGFICRKVVLEINWYKSDCGVIISEMDGKPVACVPKAHGYLLCTPDGKEKPLTKALAMQITPSAWTIRRTLPDKKLTRKDIMTFVKGSFRRSEIALLALWTLLCTLIGVLLPKLNQLIYDEYIPLGEPNVLLQVCMVIASFMLGNVFITIVKQIQEFRIPSRAGYELQDALFHRVLQLPENFFRRYNSGDMAERLTGVDTLATTLITKALTGGFSLVMVVIYLCQMASYSGKLTAVSLLMVLLYGGVIFLISLAALKHTRDSAKYNGEANGSLIQLLHGVEKIRMAGMEKHALLEYTRPVAKEKQAHIRAERNEAVVSVLADAGATIFSMVLYYMMVKSKLDLSLGSFLAFEAAFGAMTGALMGLVQSGIDCTRLRPTIERVKPFFTSEPEVTSDKQVLHKLSGAIQMDRVTFAYQEGSTPVINDLSLSIRPGEYVAIVGASGCGKSTLLKLLLGFEKPQEGRVLYDGNDLESLDQRSLRRHLGIVLQHGQLIDGSIAENITVTAANPSREAIMRAIDDVGLTRDIQAMPMHEQTMVSDASDTISGGQKQRILIARAIYSNPAILFFDEATSALDNVTQALVCDNLARRNITRLVIAHRLSTVQKCDRILVMDKGRIVESGTYQELMLRRGLFYQMASRQLADTPC